MSVPRSHLVPTRHLTDQPNLEQLRKQAKELLQEFRSGAPEAMAEVNLFERNPDREKLPSATHRECLRALTVLPVGPS